MRYLIHNRTPEGRKAPATVITRDERVVWASQAFHWSLEMPLHRVLDFARRKGLFVKCAGPECAPPPVKRVAR